MNLSELLKEEIRLEYKPQVCIDSLNLTNIKPKLDKEVLALVLNRSIFPPTILRRTTQGIEAHSNIALLETLLFVFKNQSSLTPRNLVRRVIETYFSTVTLSEDVSDQDFENYLQAFKKLTSSNISV